MYDCGLDLHAKSSPACPESGIRDMTRRFCPPLAALLVLGVPPGAPVSSRLARSAQPPPICVANP